MNTYIYSDYVKVTGDEYEDICFPIKSHLTKDELCQKIYDKAMTGKFILGIDYHTAGNIEDLKNSIQLLEDWVQCKGYVDQ